MSERKRIRREDPARTAPIRNFSNLYRRPEAMCGSQTANGASAEAASPRAGDGNPVAQAVEMGYRVIERYLQTGRQAAGQFNSRPYGIQPTGADKVPQLLDRLARSYSEMLPVWLELASSLVRVDRQYPAPASEDVKSTANGASHNGCGGVAIEVASKRPVRVSLELREPANGVPMTTHGLRAIEPDKPALTNVSFVRSENNGGSVLRIAIPDGHPPGTYSGVVVDAEKGETRGTLSVRIAN